MTLSDIGTIAWKIIELMKERTDRTQALTFLQICSKVLEKPPEEITDEDIRHVKKAVKNINKNARELGFYIYADLMENERRKYEWRFYARTDLESLQSVIERLEAILDGLANKIEELKRDFDGKSWQERTKDLDVAIEQHRQEVVELQAKLTKKELPAITIPPSLSSTISSMVLKRDRYGLWWCKFCGLKFGQNDESCINHMAEELQKETQRKFAREINSNAWTPKNVNDERLLNRYRREDKAEERKKYLEMWKQGKANRDKKKHKR